jgi:hypothetical protein
MPLNESVNRLPANARINEPSLFSRHPCAQLIEGDRIALKCGQLQPWRKLEAIPSWTMQLVMLGKQFFVIRTLSSLL